MGSATAMEVWMEGEDGVGCKLCESGVDEEFGAEKEEHEMGMLTRD
jgi:hypothetical protein